MGVISFASLKGGVGKTSLSMNVAQAFAERGCRTLILDLDPSAHATRFFYRRLALRSEREVPPGTESSFIKLLLSPDERTMDRESIAEALHSEGVILQAGEDLDFLPGGNELRHILVGRGAKAFTRRFPLIIEELRDLYDHIVIDTSPDFNILTRNALALSDLGVVPVDPSEMSIHSLEELLQSSKHLHRPTWVVLRTMVNKKAQRTSALSEERLKQRLVMRSIDEGPSDDVLPEYDIENPYDFMRMLQDWERDNGSSLEAPSRPAAAQARKPLYLLRSLVYRTEQQNQLSFTGMTAFDAKITKALASQYLAIARELESLMTSDAVGGSSQGGEDEDVEAPQSAGIADRVASHA